MKTRKLLFTMIAAMTMMFGLTLTAHAEEAAPAPAPATKVVGVEGIGTFTVPADWSDGEYIDNCGTFWFNPTRTAYVGVSMVDDGTPNPPIEAYSAALRGNVEANGVMIIDWQVTKYFGHDSIYGVMVGPEVKAISANHPAFSAGGFECSHNYYSGNSLMESFGGAASVEDFQMILPVLATYQPAQ